MFSVKNIQEERKDIMKQDVKDFMIQKVKEMMDSFSCCAEAKEAGQRWLDALGTEKEAEETKNLMAELEEDIMPGSSMLLTVIISLPLGILAAVRQNKFTDYLIRTSSFIGSSLPNFFVALLLMYFLSIRLPVFPVISEGINIKSIVLPTLTLGIAMSARYLRQIRAAVLEELGKEYVAGEKARGIEFSSTLWKSVLRSCLVTILTLMALSIGSLLGGTAIVESIFMWDGVGKLAVDAINMRDYPVIQAYVVWMAMIYVIVNLATDVIYRLIDPRIRLEGERR